jgi:hypothetical protein
MIRGLAPTRRIAPRITPATASDISGDVSNCSV